MAFSFESFNLENYFIRHSFFLAELDLRPTGNGQLKEAADFSFEVVQRSTAAGLRSTNFPELYLRQQDFRLKLQRPGDEQWLADSSFHLEPGLADASCLSFRSASHPDRYIRHRDLHLFVEPLTSPNLWPDATFRPVADRPFGG